MKKGKITCPFCHHACEMAEGETGFCRTRGVREGRLVSLSYGLLTSVALDPIEKKPLYHFFPDSRILSVGSFGCNLACPFPRETLESLQAAARRYLRHVYLGNI